MEDKNLQFYLEKTFSQNPSDIAHLLKYLYYSIIRFDTKNWYYFTNHRWYKYDVDQSPLIPLIKNEVVNKYLTLVDHYNKKVKNLTTQLNTIEDENPEKMEIYIPLVRSDLMYKSQICYELGSKLINHSYCQKVNDIAQELLTQKDFSLTLDTNPNLIGFNNGVIHLPSGKFDLVKQENYILMSVNYDYTSEMTYTKDVITFFEQLGLNRMLPVLAGFLSGNYREPVIWVTGLNQSSLTAISDLLELRMCEK